MGDTTIEIKQNSYPWMKLFLPTTTNIGSDLPVDPQVVHEDHIMKIKEITSALNRSMELGKQKEEELKLKCSIIDEMKVISAHTFDDLQQKGVLLNKLVSEKVADIENLQTTLAEKERLLDEANALLHVQGENQNVVYAELLYLVTVSSITNKNAGMSRTQGRQKTLNRLLRWLQERRNVVDYLRVNRVNPDIADDLENILFVDESFINNLLDRVLIN